MEFRLLGLFEVSEDGRVVELPRGKERALLAVLLLHANEPVSVDRLVEDLWGERPPENATKAVQVYVSRLRKSLGAERLQTTRGGYVVAAAESELDSACFEQLARRGQEALGRGSPKEAEQHLSEALAFWRGPALGDFRFESFAQLELRRLEELRDQTIADRVDSRLAQGWTSGVTPELEELVARNPLWERPRGQLMRALYQTGKQADALELYRKTRTLLADELGIEPSPELQALEKAILNQDESLARPESPARRALRRRGGKLLVAGGLLLLGTALTTAAVVAMRGSSGISRLAPDSVGVIDAASERITAQLPVAGSPTRLGAKGSSVWVGSDQARTLSALDRRTDAVAHVVAATGFPSDIAVGEGAVWVLDGESGLLTKVDPSYASVAKQTRVAARNTISYDRSRESLDPTAVAAGLGSVWTTDGSNRLTRLNPTTTTIVNRLDLSSPLDDVAVGAGAVWAISGPAATVFRLDRHGHATLRVSIVSKPGAESPYPISIAVGAGFVWVLNANTATVTKIDPTQRVVVATIQLGVQRRPVRLAAGAGAAWVADGDGTLARIDAASDHVDPLAVAGALRDVAVVGQTVWVTAAAGPGSTTGASAAASSGQLRPLPAAFCSPIYSASGTRPHYLIVGDLAFQGSGGTEAAQAAEAIEFIVKQHRFRAGHYVIGYQSCDNSSAAGGYPTAAKCKAIARAYVGDAGVVGLIGAWSSLCSQAQLPITNSAHGGPLPMVSPNNSYVGLTHHGPGTAPDEPAKYYPTGTRSFVRVSPADDAQGAADAVLARRLGARRVYVLRDGTAYGDGVAAGFVRAARRLGLIVVGPTLWNFASDNRPFIGRASRARADAVFLGTFFMPESVHLIKDLRHTLPPGTLLIAPDGFEPAYLVASAGAAAEHMVVSALGRPLEQLPAAGRRFAEDFKRATGATPTSPTIDAAQATEVLLGAIERSNGTRASIVKQLFRTRITNGILGSFGFDRNGDTTAGAITIYRITHGSPAIFTVITPKSALTR